MTPLIFYQNSRTQVLLAALVIITICLPAVAQQSPVAAKPAAEDPLEQFNETVEALVKRVWPSVVQIVVTSYGPREQTDRGETSVIVGRQRSVGSGFVIDGD